MRTIKLILAIQSFRKLKPPPYLNRTFGKLVSYKRRLAIGIMSTTYPSIPPPSYEAWYYYLKSQVQR